MRSSFVAVFVPSIALAGLLTGANAHADQAAPPQAPPQLPPPVQPADPSGPPPMQPAPAQPAPVQPAPPPPVIGVSPAPAPYAYVEPEPPTHAPKYSLWLGARAGYLGFGYGFYINELNDTETTGNFAGNGLTLEADVGARLGRRYVPYVFFEHGFMKQGHRFSGTDASTSSDFYGVGFRYTAGDPDEVGFLTDLAIGVRKLTITNGSETYSMSGLEIFRLGLGAEIRLATTFTISPMLNVSSGAFSDTSGTVAFAPNQGDGLTRPTFRDGKNIDDSRAYVLLQLSVGGHFDLLGK